MVNKKISHGTVHKTPTDVKKVILSKESVHEIWEDITPLARNEWICWIEDAKKIETREKRILVMLDKFKKGMRRPCCWAGCPHR
ncbi:YdeI/OmpD-associated family protein [Candidatus Parcubacteria bacterium]|nr:YdeI/OmpD-associated family protein [Candidatus Parcubacteria bacterium]